MARILLSDSTGMNHTATIAPIHGGAPLPIAAVGQPLSVHFVIARYHGALLSFLRQRLRLAEDAHDVAQEAYIRLMKYEGSREVLSPPSLLFRIAINVAHDLQRHQYRAGGVLDGDELGAERVPCGSATPERELEAEQDLDLVYRVIEQLPPRCRQVFLLSRFHGMTYPEIARHCGISVKMVEKHVGHALAVCAQKLER